LSLLRIYYDLIVYKDTGTFTTFLSFV
jgi:hypothetical protein